MASYIPPQSVFLYQSNWTTEIGEVMLRTIIKMKKAAKWNGVVIPPEFIREVIDVINAEVGILFSWDDVYGRWLFFERRYRSFTGVLAISGIHWNVNTNVITGPESAWKDILKENKQAGAYYYIADPEFNNQDTIFGGNVAKTEKKVEVIILSDSTVHVEKSPAWVEPDARFEHTPTRSESVSSLVLEGHPKMRRKLFDKESANEGSSYYSPGANGKLEYKQSTAQASTRILMKPAPPYASPRGTSCASSSSPYKWAKK